MSRAEALKAFARAARLSEAQLADFKPLDEAALRALTARIDHAYRQQEHALARALEGTLDHLPLLLRGPVRKIFGG